MPSALNSKELFGLLGECHGQLHERSVGEPVSSAKRSSFFLQALTYPHMYTYIYVCFEEHVVACRGAEYVNPDSQMSAELETAVPDKTRHASTAAIAGLQQAAVHLPHLQLLHLAGVPVLAADMSALAIALASFSASLTHLALDIIDASSRHEHMHLTCGRGRRLDDQHTPDSRRTLFGAISQMHKLKGLFVWRWNELIGESFADAPALRGLPKLSYVRVDGVPCYKCNPAGCPQHPPGLAFKPNNCVISVARSAAGARVVSVAQPAATA